MLSVPDPKNVIYGLFCLCHPSDGIRYVGQTSVGAYTRLHGHLSMVPYRVNHNLPLSHSQKWIKKHGAENIAVTVLEVCLDSDDLNAAEPRWIAQFDNLTNVESGGKAARGHKRSAEAAAKMKGERNPMYGKDRSKLLAYARSFQGPLTDATRKRMSEAQKGRRHSPETLAKMRKGQSASWTPERRKTFSAARTGTSHPFYGKHQSEEARHRISLARTQLTPDDIREIRKLRETGLKYREIADRFPGKASKDVVGAICAGRKFAWLV